MLRLNKSKEYRRLIDISKEAMPPKGKEEKEENEDGCGLLLHAPIKDAERMYTRCNVDTRHTCRVCTFFRALGAAQSVSKYYNSFLANTSLLICVVLAPIPCK